MQRWWSSATSAEDASAAGRSRCAWSRCPSRTCSLCAGEDWGRRGGDVVAVGEDHAVPRADWCVAVIRAHAEHPERRCGRGLPGQRDRRDPLPDGRTSSPSPPRGTPPMPALPSGPPTAAPRRSPSSAPYSRASSPGPAGWFEADLIPSLFAAGKIVADERIVVDHFQDHGSLWSIRNAFDSACSSVRLRARPSSTPRPGASSPGGRSAAIPGRLREEAREGSRDEARTPVLESALIGLIAIAAGLGAVAGTMLGPGGSADRVA